MRRLLILLPALWLTACPADLEVAPAFVTVEGFTLTTGPGQGAATTDVREVWAFIGEEFLGVFPLPARIPVHAVGTRELRLEAGIRQDGRSATPDVYPFYAPVTRSVDLSSGETTALGTLPLVYRPETVFGFVEDFEGSERAFTTADGAGTLERQTETVRSGAGAGVILLTPGNPLTEVTTVRTFRGLDAVPINVWLEVDYRGDAAGVFGVTGERDALPVRVFDPGFRPRPEWTKIYFNLGPVIGSAALPELRVALSVLLASGSGAGAVYLDNVKLLYLPAS